jgi:hypothetical protein
MRRIALGVRSSGKRAWLSAPRFGLLRWSASRENVEDESARCAARPQDEPRGERV